MNKSKGLPWEEEVTPSRREDYTPPRHTPIPPPPVDDATHTQIYYRAEVIEYVLRASFSTIWKKLEEMEKKLKSLEKAK